MKKCILICCLVLIYSSVSSAEESQAKISAVTETSHSKSQEAVDQVGKHDNSEELIKWLNSVKPAAGNTQPGVGSTNYWEQSVNRRTRSGKTLD